MGETGSGVFAFLYKLFFIGVNRFSNTNLKMSVVIKREERPVRVYVRSSQMVCLCYCSSTSVTRRDDKQRI